MQGINSFINVWIWTSIKKKDGNKQPGLENLESAVLLSLCLLQDTKVVLLKLV